MPLNQIPFQRYHSLPETLSLTNSPFLNQLNLNLHNQITSNDVSHVVNTNFQNGLQADETFGDNMANGDKCNGSRQQQVANGNSFWASNYGNFPTSWAVNHLYNFKKGNQISPKNFVTLLSI